VCKYDSHGDSLYTKQMTIDYIKMIKESSSYEVFAICDNETKQHIGNISLQNISQKNKSAEFAIIIGEKSFMGKGIGKEAGKIILEYAFNTLKLHRVYCGTSEYNIAMQKLALHLKMKEEGIGIDAMVKNEEYINIFKYAIVNNK
jgi:RimJ/RimL family protein N-acetyltransferase